MKKLFFCLIFVFSTYLLFPQNEKIIIRVVDSIDENGNVFETIYERDYPKTAEEAKTVIDSIVKVYNNTTDTLITNTKEYVKFKKENDSILNKLETEIIELQKKIDEKNNIDDQIFDISKRNFVNIGTYLDYTYIKSVSNNIGLGMMVKIHKFGILGGFDVSIDKNNNPCFGFNIGLGYWFY